MLLIEGEPGYAGMVRRILERGKDADIELVWADSLSKGIELLKINEIGDRGDDGCPGTKYRNRVGYFEIALLDLTLPDSRGIATLRSVLEKVPDVPVIVLTGMDDEKLSIEALKEGAQDYFVKGAGEKAFLLRAIRYAIERKRAQERLKAATVEEERLKVLLQMAGAMAHELSQPLTVLLNSIELMKHCLGDPEKLARQMGGVARAGERIAGIVKNIQAIQDVKSYETKPYLQDLSIIKLD